MGFFGFPGLKVETCGTGQVEPSSRLRQWFRVHTHSMRNEFTAVIERDGEWFVAWSPEIPGANGQRRSVEECRESLGAAIQLILEDRVACKVSQ
jgi:predicted RNase H-like HicB family nuclease